MTETYVEQQVQARKCDDELHCDKQLRGHLHFSRIGIGQGSVSSGLQGYSVGPTRECVASGLQGYDDEQTQNDQIKLLESQVAVMMKEFTDLRRENSELAKKVDELQSNKVRIVVQVETLEKVVHAHEIFQKETKTELAERAKETKQMSKTLIAVEKNIVEIVNKKKIEYYGPAINSLAIGDSGDLSARVLKLEKKVAAMESDFSHRLTKLELLDIAKAVISPSPNNNNNTLINDVRQARNQMTELVKNRVKEPIAVPTLFDQSALFSENKLKLIRRHAETVNRDAEFAHEVKILKEKVERNLIGGGGNWFANPNRSNLENAITSVLILDGSSSYLFDSRLQIWQRLKITFPMGICNFGAVLVNEKIYIMGGYGNDEPLTNCFELNSAGGWKVLAPMNRRRDGICNSCLVYKGDIWAIGGNATESQKSTEKYDIAQNRWTFMPQLNVNRSDAAAAVFKDKIFVTGGSNKSATPLNSVEMFDIVLQKWILFHEVPVNLHSHAMIFNNSTLTIFGGLSKSGGLSSVWEIDVEAHGTKWTKKQDFTHSRYSFGAAKLSCGMTVFGGWGSINSGVTSEIFDGRRWISGPSLPQELAMFAHIAIPRSLEDRLKDKFAFN